MKEKIYVINGKRYSSLKEIPPEYIDLLKKEAITFNTENANTEKKIAIIAPLTRKDSSTRLALVKYFVYGLGQIISLVEGQSLRTVERLLHLPHISFIGSLFLGLIVGQVSYLLTMKHYSQIYKGVKIEFSENLSFIKDFQIVQISAMYAGFINIGVYIIICLGQFLLQLK